MRRIRGQVLQLAVAELPVNVGKPIRHPDLLAMTVSGEVERLRVVAVRGVSPRRGRLLSRRSTTYFLLTRQHGTNQRTRSLRPKHVAGRARTDYLRPPEPTSEQRGDRRCHERAHDQGVEQQAQADVVPT